MTSLQIKEQICDLTNTLVEKLSQTEMKLRAAEDKIRKLEDKIKSMEEVEPLFPPVPKHESLDHVRLLPYDWKSFLGRHDSYDEENQVSLQTNLTCPDKGIDSISHHDSRHTNGNLMDDLIRNKKLMLNYKQMRDDEMDRRTLVICGLKSFFHKVIRFNLNWSDIVAEGNYRTATELYEEVLSFYALDFLFRDTVNKKWFFDTGTLKLTYGDAKQCHHTLRRLRQWTGFFRSGLNAEHEQDQAKLKTYQALMSIKFSLAVPARLKEDRKYLQKLAMTLKARKEITWFYFYVGENSEKKTGLILKVYDKESKKLLYDKFGKFK